MRQLLAQNAKRWQPSKSSYPPASAAPWPKMAEKLVL
jgi:hypothetical protein